MLDLLFFQDEIFVREKADKLHVIWIILSSFIHCLNIVNGKVCWKDCLVIIAKAQSNIKSIIVFGFPCYKFTLLQ